MTANTLGNRIKQARDIKNYSITQLSRRLAVAPTTLKKWEAGRSDPRTNKLNMLAGVLGVSMQWLLEGGDDDPVNHSDDTPLTILISQKLERAHKLQQELSDILFELDQDVANLHVDMHSD